MVAWTYSATKTHTHMLWVVAAENLHLFSKVKKNKTKKNH